MNGPLCLPRRCTAASFKKVPLNASHVPPGSLLALSAAQQQTGRSLHYETSVVKRVVSLGEVEIRGEARGMYMWFVGDVGGAGGGDNVSAMTIGQSNKNTKCSERFEENCEVAKSLRKQDFLRLLSNIYEAEQRGASGLKA